MILRYGYDNFCSFNLFKQIKKKLNENILVTGGAGYIGSHVCNLLLDKKNEVIVVDNLVTGNKNLIPKKAKLVISDINDEKKIENLIIKKEKFDLVMHFAGLIRVDESL